MKNITSMVCLVYILHCNILNTNPIAWLIIVDEAEAQDVETQQTQINKMPPGISSKQKARGSRINLEFIAGGSGKLNTKLKQSECTR